MYITLININVEIKLMFYSQYPFVLSLFQSESMVLDTAENVNNGNPSPLEALLAGAEGFPPMLDIPPDADDETMVELAIALSLQQDQQGRKLTFLSVKHNS